MATAFHPAKHHAWIIRIAQWGNALELAWHTRLALDPRDLDVLRALPADAGFILAVNHADETDLRVCMELARRSRRRFTYMINTEAFEEWRGLAGWWLQRLGGFSVERGGQDHAAKRYAVDVVTRGRDVLVIFPEGEVHYLNDLVQPLKTGAVHIGFQAMTETRDAGAPRTVSLVPVAIKYRYRTTIGVLLDKRIKRMEQRLIRRAGRLSLQERLARIMADRLHRDTLLSRTQKSARKLARLTDQVREVRETTLSEIESRYPQRQSDPKAQLIDRAHKMLFFLRQQAGRRRLFSAETRQQLQQDMRDLKRTIHMAGWQPQYTQLNPSQERLAETVMKLERDVFKKARPRSFGNRNVVIRIGHPVDLGQYVESYKDDPSAVSHQVADALRDAIQSLIDESLVPPAHDRRKPDGLGYA